MKATCPYCGYSFDVDEKSMGQLYRCSKCRELFRVGEKPEETFATKREFEEKWKSALASKSKIQTVNKNDSEKSQKNPEEQTVTSKVNNDEPLSKNEVEPVANLESQNTLDSKAQKEVHDVPTKSVTASVIVTLIALPFVVPLVRLCSYYFLGGTVGQMTRFVWFMQDNILGDYHFAVHYFDITACSPLEFVLILLIETGIFLGITRINDTSNKSKAVKEKDNVGTRIETVGDARSYYMSTIIADMGGEICWKFKTKQDAMDALLELSCVSISEDTRRLVCTEPLNFGVYPFKPWDDYVGEFKWAALLSGVNLDEELWLDAKRAFEKHKGTSHRENKPKPADETNESPPEKLDSVTFSHKRKAKAPFSSKKCTYHYYKAPNKATAIKWLQTQTVTKALLYLVVETPDGTFSKDKMGMY